MVWEVYSCKWMVVWLGVWKGCVDDNGVVYVYVIELFDVWCVEFWEVRDLIFCYLNYCCVLSD